VLDLLCHCTGLPRHDWLHEPGDLAPADMLGLMRHLELSRDVRSAFQYNNLCYNVAGLLVERLSGQSYEAFIRARLTDRLGMNVGFSLDDLEASNEPARPYMMHEDMRLPAVRLPIRTTASGAMTTSVADFANWMRLHLGTGELDGERLLPAALIGELHVPRVYIPSQSLFAEFGDAHYGLGFQCISYRGDRLDGGGWPGWNTQMTLVPDFGIGVAVFTNRSPNAVTETLTYYIIDGCVAASRSHGASAFVSGATKASPIFRPARTCERRPAAPTRGRRTSLLPIPATMATPPTG
jgi:CubicO group peptidase (beta-lactamase class C family)